MPSKARRDARSVILVLTCMLLLCVSTSGAAAQTPPPYASPRILVLRGVFEVFSLGMNNLAEKLRNRGYDAKSTSWSLALTEAQCDDDRPLVIIGHSLGGRMCAWLPRKLKSCGKRVPLVIIVDANLFQTIPDNVDRCLNLYVTNKMGIFHGSPVSGESCSTQIVNWDISEGQPSMFAGGVNHFDIDSVDWVHDIIIDEIERSYPSLTVDSIGRRARPSTIPSVAVRTHSSSRDTRTFVTTRGIVVDPFPSDDRLPRNRSLASRSIRTRLTRLTTSSTTPQRQSVAWSPTRPGQSLHTESVHSSVASSTPLRTRPRASADETVKIADAALPPARVSAPQPTPSRVAWRPNRRSTTYDTSTRNLH